MSETCYACESTATTREHVPPRGFFPEGFRRNLITVPSCEEHNLGNSIHIEYVRNLVTSVISTNEPARAHFLDKVRRSYQHSPELLNRVLKATTEIMLDGSMRQVTRIELPRFMEVMRAIASALHRHDCGVNFAGDWDIFSPSMVVVDRRLAGLSDGNEDVRGWLESIPFVEARTANSVIFRYASYAAGQSGVYCYRLTFFEGFEVYALGSPKRTP